MELISALFMVFVLWPFLCVLVPRRGGKWAFKPTETRALTIWAWSWGLGAMVLLSRDLDVLFVGVGCVALLVVAFLRFWRPARLKTTFQLLARRRGMKQAPAALLSGGHPSLRTNAVNPIKRSYNRYSENGIRHTIEPVVTARKRYKHVLYRLGIRIPGIPYNISFLPFPWRGSKPLAREIRSLHPAFEFVSGSGASALAIMNTPEILDAVEQHFGDRCPRGFRGEGPTLIGGTIELTVRADTKELEHGLDVLSELAQKIYRNEKSVPQLLLENVGHDDPAFQRLSFNALLTIYRDVQTKVELLRRGLAHPNDDIRITAATHLPREAFDELVSFVESGKPRHQARAMAVIHQNYPWERFGDLASAALDSSNETLVAEAIRGHRKCGDPTKVALIAPFLRSSSAMARAAADALGALGPTAEPHLVQALERPEVEVVEAVVATLQQTGGRDAAVALNELAHREDLPNALRRDAAAAADTIKKDLVGDRGRLSLVEIAPHEGQLSVAEDEGALAVVNAEDAECAHQQAVETEKVEEI